MFDTRLFLYFTGISALALLGTSAFNAYTSSAETTLATPVITAPTLNKKNVAPIREDFVRFQGTADPNTNIVIQLNERSRYQPGGAVTNETGEFIFAVPLKNRQANKHILVKLFAQDPQTKQLSDPAQLELVVK